VTSKRIADKIEKKSTQRRRALAGEGAPGDVSRLDAELSELYEELRVARARSNYGDRDVIVKRARVDRELEKLMGDGNGK
jgi:hypothetical protein